MINIKTVRLAKEDKEKMSLEYGRNYQPYCTHSDQLRSKFGVKSAGESQLQQNATLCDPMSLNFKAYNQRVIS